ncbi:MAG: LacI family DNA-binding transcriptional regulator [Lachnospiraceae bacterium]|nr:LacI family DNA-binding transcriptional regulator [Lachnospiraceae bacterium]
MSISMKELAKKINVSPSTVSRVINGNKNVSPETYKLVMDAVEKYNYIPNEAARNLKSCQSSTVGILVSDLSNSFYTSIIAGAEAELKSHGYSIILSNYNEDYYQQIAYTKLMLSRNVAGLIMSPSGDSRPYYDIFTGTSVPIVYVDTYPADRPDCDCVMIDNSTAAYRLANHMIDMYGDDIFILSTHEGYSMTDGTHTSDLRYNAIKQAFSDRGLSVRSGFEYTSEKSSYSAGYEYIDRLLRDGLRPRAILSTSNNITYGAIAAISDFGLVVPSDIAVACFDATDPTGLVRPRITSINQPSCKMGELAARLLLERIANPDDHFSQKVMVDPIFEIQESCGYTEYLRRRDAYK